MTVVTSGSYLLNGSDVSQQSRDQLAYLRNQVKATIPGRRQSLSLKNSLISSDELSLVVDR